MQIEYECKIMVTSIIRSHVGRSAGVDSGEKSFGVRFRFYQGFYICLRPKCLNSRNMRGSKLIFCFPYISDIDGR